MSLMRTLIMTTLFASATTSPIAMPVQSQPVELDGTAARALTAAYAAFHEKLPEAAIERYTVQVFPPQGAEVKVVFSPALQPGEVPTLGGRGAAGRELNVWVATPGYAIARVSFAR